MLLEDRVCVVSGIGPGMGRDVSLALAREGANSSSRLARRSAARSRRRCAPLAAGRSVLPTDITRPNDCQTLVDAARAEFGRVDVLVNNAFLAQYDPLVAQADLDDWRRIFDVNLFGSIQLSQDGPYMKAQGAARSSWSTRCRCGSSSRASAATRPRRVP